MKLGGKNITALKLGSVDVTKLALGANEIWGGGDTEPPVDPPPDGELHYEMDFSPFREGGRALEFYGWPGNNRYIYQWDEAGQTAAQTEIYARVAWIYGGSETMNMARLYMGIGVLGPDSGIYLDMCANRNLLRINSPDLNTTFATYYRTNKAEQFLNAVMQHDNGTLRAKTWHDDEPEPETWQLETVLGYTIPGGGIGIGAWHGQDMFWDAVGVGKGGEPAPRTQQALSPNQHFTDFSDKELGSTGGFSLAGPAGHSWRVVAASTDWYRIVSPKLERHPTWGTNGNVYSVLDDEDGPIHVLTAYFASEPKNAWMLKGVGDLEDFDIRSRVYMFRGFEPLRIVGRMSRDQRAGVWLEWDNVSGQNEVRIKRLSPDGQEATLATAYKTGMTDIADRLEMLFQVEGENIRAKLWLQGDDEPTVWDIEAVDPDPLPAGAIGITIPSGRVNDVELLVVDSPPKAEAPSIPRLEAPSDFVITGNEASRTLSWVDPPGAAAVRVLFRQHPMANLELVDTVAPGVEELYIERNLPTYYDPQYHLQAVDEYGRLGDYVAMWGKWTDGQFVWNFIEPME